MDGWSLRLLDVNTAFLYAALDDEEDGVFIVRPPSLYVKLGLVKTHVYWKVQKVLYGFRSGPQKWGLHRDACIKAENAKCREKT